MGAKDLTGKVQTVLGLMHPDELGVTLMHEHILTDLSVFFLEPKEATLREVARQPLSLENLYLVRYNPPSNIDNCRYTDEALMTKETMRFKTAGGNTIVEMSNHGLHGDPEGLSRISRMTGLNIITGTGFYIGKSQTTEALSKSVDEMAVFIAEEIFEGIGGTNIRAGIIGEIGCNAPLEEFEIKSLTAAAKAQQETGAMINIHPSHKDDLVLENVRILDEAGADLTRVVVSHCDAWGFTKEVQLQLLDKGCVVEYDTFGFEGIYPLYWGHHINMMTDEDRIKNILSFIDRGYINQISIASDHCFKHLLTSYGGGGYDHILRNDVPLMKINGMGDEIINHLLVENPKRLLAFR
jgi:phosphotriesterase-related protein